MTRSMDIVDRLIAITTRAADTYLVLTVILGLLAAALLVVLWATGQLSGVGAVGNAAILIVAAALLAFTLTERACVNALQAGKKRVLDAAAMRAAPPEPLSPAEAAAKGGKP